MKATGFIIAVIAVDSVLAQPAVDTVYRVEVTATASPIMSFFRDPRVPGTTSQLSMGYGASLRALWHPGRLLSVGLLSGYFVIARDKISVELFPAPDREYSAQLAAIPLQLALTMQKREFELGIGLGPYLMLSTIEGGGSPPASGRRFELGMTFFGAYLFPLGPNIRAGPELRVLSFRYRGIVSVMPSFSLRLNALRY